MVNFTNPLTPISYTNKDFRSIIEELIDLTKKLTDKWDPSITNESDPAMVLLKLNAIIGDKNNYNIDKNILEAFPETLTQDVSARSMYKQLGYQMPWYRSAKTKITIAWIGDDLTLGQLVTIPKYTMVCNDDSSIVYTLIEDVNLTKDQPVAQVNALQGFIEDLIVNGSKDIQLNNLDSNNRIYFGNSNIAQNGIFINNVDQNTYWTEKTNLQVEHEGNTYYEFGIDLRTNNVYVEFPEDIETLIKNGLNIKYLVTSGTKGNVSAEQITKFYNDVSIKLGEETITLNETNIEMYNPSATVDNLETGSLSGHDPQSIRDAYKSWKKTVATFETLVTLRDYINAIYNSGLVSNDIVSDRLTDMQTAYKIITDSASFSSIIIKMEDDEETGKAKMDPYLLRLYLLHNPGEIVDINSYESSFELEEANSLAQRTVQNYLEETKCITHDFEGIKPNLPALFRNVYSLKIKIVPQYFLTSAQINEVKRNIVKDLWDLLNARKVEFGEEPEYYLIYDTINNADERIKLTVLEDFNYTTYATYWDDKSNQFKHIPVSEFNDPYIIVDTNIEALETKLQTLDDPTRFLFINKADNYKVYKYNGTKDISEDGKKVTLKLDEYSDKIQEFRTDILAKNILAGVTPLYNQKTTFQYTIDQQELLEDNDVDRITTDLDLSPFGYDDIIPPDDPKPKPVEEGNNIATYKLKENEVLQFLGPSFITDENYSSYVMFEFIMNKSSGYTEWVAANPNYYNIETNQYGYINAQLVASTKEQVNNPEYITFHYYDPEDSYKGKTVDFKLTEKTINIKGVNRTYADAFKDGYISMYIEQEARRISSNESYQLKDGDAIVFFYKEDSDIDDSPYTYVVYKGSNSTNLADIITIKPNFTLNGVSFEDSKVYKFLDTGSLNVKKYSGKVYSGTSSNGAYGIISGLYGDNGLSGTKQIDVQRLNEVEFKKGTRAYYFITNTLTADKKYYKMTLTNTGVNEYEYILGPDEYFIYCDLNGQTYEMLGYGSFIKFTDLNLIKNSDNEYNLYVDVINYNDIALNGLSAFTNHLLTPTSSYDDTPVFYPDAIVTLREQQIYNFAQNDEVMFTITDDYKKDVYPSFNSTTWTSLNGINVKYKTAGSNAFEELPKFNLNVQKIEDNWRGKAILNINTQSDSPQILDNTVDEDSEGNPVPNSRQAIQRITINDVTFPSKDEDLNEQMLRYILTDIVLNKVGGQNIDITYLNELGERKNVDILVYTLLPEFQKLPFHKDGSNILMDITGNSHTVTNIQLQNGYNYIL